MEDTQDVKALLLVIEEKDRIIDNLSVSLEKSRCDILETSRDLDVYKKMVVNSQVETYNELNRKYNDLLVKHQALQRLRSRPLIDDRWSVVVFAIVMAWAIFATFAMVMLP